MVLPQNAGKALNRNVSADLVAAIHAFDDLARIAVRNAENAHAQAVAAKGILERLQHPCADSAQTNVADALANVNETKAAYRKLHNALDSALFAIERNPDATFALAEILAPNLADALIAENAILARIALAGQLAQDILRITAKYPDQMPAAIQSALNNNGR